MAVVVAEKDVMINICVLAEGERKHGYYVVVFSFITMYVGDDTRKKIM